MVVLDYWQNMEIHLLNCYNQLIQNIHGLFYRFEKVPMVHWSLGENQKQFMDWLGKELEFNQMDDWYKVTVKNIEEKGGTGLLIRYGNSIFKLISCTYPEYVWEKSSFNLK